MNNHWPYYIDPFITPLHPSVAVLPGAVIGILPVATAANRRKLAVPFNDVDIGEGSVIGAQAVVYAGVLIGERSRLGDHAIMREGSRCGIECVIGTNADIQYDVRIGHRAKIMNGCHITGGSIIGDDCFFGPGVYMANDNGIDPMNYTDRPADRHAPIIGKGVFIGVGAIILPGVFIGDYAKVGAGAVVTKSVEARAIVAGIPARVREAGAFSRSSLAQP